jgi:hypothetical protein
MTEAGRRVDDRYILTNLMASGAVVGFCIRCGALVTVMQFTLHDSFHEGLNPDPRQPRKVKHG